MNFGTIFDVKKQIKIRACILLNTLQINLTIKN